MFEKKYPYLASWVETTGYLEIGSHEMSDSSLRIINEGGMIWEDNDATQIDEALKNGERYLKEDLINEFGFELEID